MYADVPPPLLGVFMDKYVCVKEFLFPPDIQEDGVERGTRGQPSTQQVRRQWRRFDGIVSDYWFEIGPDLGLVFFSSC